MDLFQSRSPEPAVLVLVEAAAVVVVVGAATSTMTSNHQTGALWRFERFIPANAFMSVGKRLRLLVANIHSDCVTGASSG